LTGTKIMSIQELAKYGRNGDNMMMHVSDREVAGLNALARANGTQLTTNPVTGAPEAFNLLPTIAGIAGGMVGGPLGAAAASGAVTTAQTGSLEQGLMAGLTSYAGSSLGQSLGAAGQAGTDTAASGLTSTPSDTLVSAATPTGGAPVYGTMPPAPTPTPTPEFGAFNSVDAAGSMPMPTAPVTPSLNPISPATPTGGAPVFGNTPATPAAPTPTAPATSPLNDLSMDSLTTKAGNVARGAYNTFSDPTKAGEFLKANQGTIIAGGMGMAGQAALEDQQAMKDAEKELEEKKFGEAQRSWQNIADTYSKYGKSATQGMRDFASPYGVTFNQFKEGGSVDYSQRAKDAIQSKYDRQVREAGPVDRMGYGILDLMNVRDPATLRRALDQYREENDASPARGGSPYAAGGQVGNFNQATGYAGGGYLEGGMTGDGMSDDIPATIDGTDPAALSTNEYVVPADVVSHIGNGSSDAGAERLDLMLDRIRMARTGTKKQAPEIDADKYLPA
jgi:hypothetical protein